MHKANNLKKIRVALEAGSKADSMDLVLPVSEFEFIFGLGTAGMTPFEYQLVDKTAGDEVLLQLERKASHRLFEHLHPPILKLFEKRESFYLKAKIVEIQPADSKEIVKAMAAITAHGHGCDCGCGC